MRRVRSIFVVAFAALTVVTGCSDDGNDAASLTNAPTPETVGETDEDLVDLPLETTDGASTTVSTLLADGPVVLNFWASWCAPCVQEMPEFESVHQELGDRVTFVGVNVNDRADDAADMIERTGITYLVARDADGTYARAAGALNMPTTLVIAADGSVAETHLGAMSAEELRAAIGGALEP